MMRYGSPGERTATTACGAVRRIRVAPFGQRYSTRAGVERATARSPSTSAAITRLSGRCAANARLGNSHGRYGLRIVSTIGTFQEKDSRSVPPARQGTATAGAPIQPRRASNREGRVTNPCTAFYSALALSGEEIHGMQRKAGGRNGCNKQEPIARKLGCRIHHDRRTWSRLGYGDLKPWNCRGTSPQAVQQSRTPVRAG
jgi:hypothetical protein